MVKIRDERQIPMFTPDSDWVAPDAIDWPDFRGNAKIIGFDTETYDPNLLTRGPGFIRGDARLAGISLASEDGQKIYLPIGHVEGNVDPDQALRYVQHQLRSPQPKAGANMTYDLESLWSEGISVEGDLCDIQIAGPLLDEERPGGFSLESLASEYLGVGKTENLLREAAIDYGVDPKGGIAKLPAKYVGPYAEDDAYFAIKIFEKQERELIDDRVWEVFDLERRLQRILFLMRLRGVRMDLEKAEQTSKTVYAREQQLEKECLDLIGHRINLTSHDKIGAFLNAEGLHVPRTQTGKFSIKNEWLQEQDHPVCTRLAELYKAQKMRRDFIDKFIAESVDGRVYTNWQQMRDYDENGKSKGTRSGRIASNNINFTQIPSRDPYWGPLIRDMFVADEDGFWCKADYSQQEPRILLHLAYLMSRTPKGAGRYRGVEEARQRYIDNPETDYHQMTADLVLEKSGRDIGRRPAKNINLGLAYDMGKYKLANQLGLDVDEAEVIFRAYHEGVPYVDDLAKDCREAAQSRGYIRTVLGRKRRFLSWEPADFEDAKGAQPTRNRKLAEEQWGRVVRAYVRKALNSAVQGSAADQMKKSLVDLYEQKGILPQIQVYDELNLTVHSLEQVQTVKEVMENSIEMTVPFLVEPETGPSWGNTK